MYIATSQTEFGGVVKRFGGVAWSFTRSSCAAKTAPSWLDLPISAEVLEFLGRPPFFEETQKISIVKRPS